MKMDTMSSKTSAFALPTRVLTGKNVRLWVCVCVCAFLCETSRRSPGHPFDLIQKRVQITSLQLANCIKAVRSKLIRPLNYCIL